MRIKYKTAFEDPLRFTARRRGIDFPTVYSALYVILRNLSQKCGGVRAAVEFEFEFEILAKIVGVA